MLAESTWEAIRLGLTEKFLAEGQPNIGRNGHVLAVLTHRCAVAVLPDQACHAAIPGVGAGLLVNRAVRTPGTARMRLADQWHHAHCMLSCFAFSAATCGQLPRL